MAESRKQKAESRKRKEESRGLAGLKGEAGRMKAEG